MEIAPSVYSLEQIREFEYRTEESLNIPQLTPILIKKGTVLWRCAPNFNLDDFRCFSARQCSDTGKTGLYFGTYLYVSLQMCIELKTNLKLGQFVVLKDILVPYGKYAYRKLAAYGVHDLRKLPETLNISHFDNKTFPLPNKFDSRKGEKTRDDQLQQGSVMIDVSIDGGNGELFLSSTSGDLNHVRLLKQWQVTDYIQLQKILNGCKGSVDLFNAEFYSDVLRPID